jgi:hypothetical protein
MIDPNQTAFPTQMAVGGNKNYPTFLGAYCQTGFGLSVRELFAAMAMQGILANPNPSACSVEVGGGKLYSDVGREAVFMADALIDQLNQPNVTP